jgi:hypothetical protein
LSADHTLELRQAVVERIRADTALAALWDDRFYGEKPPSDPVKPFGRYGYDTMAAFNPSGISGGAVDVTIHTFAQGQSTDELKALNAAVVTALDGITLDLNGGSWCYGLTFVRSQTLPDGSDGFHGVLQFNALTGIED